MLQYNMVIISIPCVNDPYDEVWVGVSGLSKMSFPKPWVDVVRGWRGDKKWGKKEERSKCEWKRKILKQKYCLISTESTLLIVAAAVAAASIATIAVATATISTTATAATSTEATATTATAETTTTVVVVKLTAGCAFRVGTVGASYLDSLCATIIAGLDKKLNGLSFTEGAKTFGLDSTLMDKEILTTSYEEKRNTKSALRL